MKKLILFLFGVSLFVSACNNMVEVDDTQSNGFDVKGMDVFTAESENPYGRTKTILNQDGGIDWQPGDSIHIFKGTSDCGAFVATIEEQSITSDFIGRLDYSEEVKDSSFWAIYPYSKYNTCNGNSVTVHIPDKQFAAEGTFDKKAFVSIAQSDKQMLSFYNVCGGVKISVTTPNIKRILFKGNSDEILAGDACVTMDNNGHPNVQSIINPRTEVALEAPDGKSFEIGKWYYLSCLPATLTSGCSVFFQIDEPQFDAEADYVINDTIEIKRSVWGRIQDSDDGSIYNIFPDDGLIVYSTIDNKAIEVDSTLFESHVYENGFGIIVLKDGIDTLPSSSFRNQTRLKRIGIGKSISVIDGSAFSGCSGLTSIEIPEGVTSIGNSAFNGCSSLTRIVIPEGVTSIGTYVFYNCSKLISIEVPEGVTRIGNYAFCGCSSLTSIEIPEGVTSIGNYAFTGCGGLTSIEIPEGVTSIGNYVFSGCGGLTSIEIREGVTNIGNYAFNGCGSLTSIEIPESVTSIGVNAFYNCRSLTSIEIPEGVTSIGEYSFYGCGNLTSITMPKGVTSIGDYSFYGCSSLTSIEIPEGVTSIGVYTFYNCSTLTDIEIPESVTSIGSYAFYGCKSLVSVTIPEGVASIGSYAFSDCDSLSFFYSPLASEDKRCLIIDGVLTAFCPTGLSSYTIPEGVTSIGSNALHGCNSLVSVTISEGVTSIGSYAFSGCKNLVSVTIPESVSSVGSWAFSGCDSLTSFYSPLASEDKRCLIIDSVLTAFCPAGLNTYIIPEDITYIGVYAFASCGLASIEIPQGVTGIGNWAFIGNAFDNITIPNSVTTIGSGAFYNCCNLTRIEIPESVTNIGDRAFESCRSLASISLPNTIKTIPQKLLYQCAGLTSITIPGSVTSIKKEAFNSSGIKVITILATTPPSIPDYNVFPNRYALNSLTIYVPKGCVNNYKYKWQSLRDRIQEIPE